VCGALLLACLASSVPAEGPPIAAAATDRPDLPPATPQGAETLAPEGVYRAGVGGVSNPVLVRESRVTPNYPKDALSRRAQGDVVLQVIVRKDGEPVDAWFTVVVTFVFQK
jgi:outer membrane biosynthesis protein TonB